MSAKNKRWHIRHLDFIVHSYLQHEKFSELLGALSWGHYAVWTRHFDFGSKYRKCSTDMLKKYFGFCSCCESSDREYIKYIYFELYYTKAFEHTEHQLEIFYRFVKLHPILEIWKVSRLERASWWFSGIDI